VGAEDPGVARYLGRLIERVRSVPGVEDVGIINRLPMGGQTQDGVIRFEGSDVRVHAEWRSASGDYFRALGVPLLSGRTFGQIDSADRPGVGIIDERLAREVFGRESPIGKRFRIDVPGRPLVRDCGCRRASAP
jgi:putative ABC transport system permease protein